MKSDQRAKIPRLANALLLSGCSSIVKHCDCSQSFTTRNLSNMAEQIPNGDVPTNTDVEMKEESAPEVHSNGTFIIYIARLLNNNFISRPLSAMYNLP